MKSKIYDLTPLISERLAVFPGDQKFVRKVASSLAGGANYELSAMLATLHLGAHADAPSHYHRDGQDISARDLKTYFGKVQVIRAHGLRPKERLGRQHLPTDSWLKAPRVLFDTQSFPDPERWNQNFCSLEPDLLEWLAAHGVRLVGIDTPSVDPFDSKALEAHQILWQKNFAVLEGLLLGPVPEGIYSLIALPLKIENGDASPVRAILLPYTSGLDLE